MSDQSSRFAPSSQTTSAHLSNSTVGLVNFADYRKRRADALDQQDREARDAATALVTGASTGAGTGIGTSSISTPDRSQTGTPDNAGSDSSAARPTKKVKQQKVKRKLGKSSLLSFGDDGDDDEDGTDTARSPSLKAQSKDSKDPMNQEVSEDSPISIAPIEEPKSKFKPNANISIILKASTTSALRKEAAEREALRKEFLIIQEAVKATEVAIPFVFYDGANTPGGTVRVKKGDFVWVFLDKSRKVGAEKGVGEGNAQKVWARVGVDDLMLVRGTVIIPPHYDFYFFAMNKSVGPGGQRLFDYTSDMSATDIMPSINPDERASSNKVFKTSATKAAAIKALPDVNTLEGAQDDPMWTRVVDRRWYERNKHIYPASTWQEFDAEKDYATEVRRDTGGNTFFFSR